jgi:hypothetical protein
MKRNRTEVLDNFRQAILFALDDQARRNFRGAKLPPQPGAVDDDLPALFQPLDAHVETLAARYGVELTDEES